LVSLVRLGVLLLGHVAATEQVPTLCISLVGSNRLLKIFNSLLLACIVGALLMMQPSQLLKDLRVVGVTLKDPAVSALCGFELLLLFVNMPNLEPNVLLCQRARGVGNNVFEALADC
jgi:hypothetical protein